jgi:cell division transport system permease protein
MIFRRRYDLPLERREGAGLFMIGTIALMVFLAVLAIAAAMAANGAVGRWDGSLAGRFTVQIPPASADRLDAVVGLLKRARGVVRAEPLSVADTAGLLEPFLGSAIRGGDLPLPRLVDVAVDPGAPPDFAALRRSLASAAPGALLDDHHLWLGRLFALAGALQITAVGVVLLVGGAAVLAVVFATRTGLAIHHNVVEVLHLVGAHDSYIARQFERQALRLGLEGGLAGLAAAACILALLIRIAGAAGAGTAAAVAGSGSAAASLVPELALTGSQWAILMLLPLVAAAVAMLTARITVLRALGRMA